MRKATFVRDLTGFTGSAKLYRIEPPFVYDDEEHKEADHIVASATIAMFSGPETYLFPADDTGQILSWGELEGSYKGGLDHQEAIDGWVSADGR